MRPFLATGRGRLSAALSFVLILALLLDFAPTVSARKKRKEPQIDAYDRAYCGQRYVDMSQQSGSHYIVNGIIPKPRSFPWHVILSIKVPGSAMQRICGGIIIHRDLVLTAQHCLDDSPANATIQVYGGNSNLKDNSMWKVGKVTTSCHHDCYKSPSKTSHKRRQAPGPICVPNYSYDVAVLKLQNEFEYSESLQAACLPKEYDPQIENYPQTNCTMSGHGLIGNNIWADNLHALHNMKVCTDEKLDKTAKRDQTCFHTNGGGMPCNQDDGSGVYCDADGPTGDKIWVAAGVLNNYGSCSSGQAGTHANFLNTKHQARAIQKLVRECM